MLLLGTSGFSYEDWRGVFYPHAMRKEKMLEFYAECFNALEINATYYTTPGQATGRSMVARAAGRLQFAIKAPGKLTHKYELDDSVVAPWLRFIEPFREAGVLSAALFQFPNSLRESSETWGLIEVVASRFAELPLVVEFRHASWDTAAVDARLEALGISRAVLDQPIIKGLSKPQRAGDAGRIGYVRFHGRNAAEWYGKNEGDNRYRYRYSQQELMEWLPAIRDMEQRAQTTHAFFNNHPDGSAVLDAIALSAMLGKKITVRREADLFG